MNKYNARKTKIDGITFDSKAEARRYQELKMLQQAGEISGLECHPRYVVWNDGAEKITYVADFSYFEDGNGRQIVEDVKGVKTQVYKLKKKMFKATHPEIDFREVRA